MLFKSTTFLSLLTLALSAEFIAFDGPNCTGNSKLINVWDNTCASNPGFSWKSYRPVAYGANRQRVAFYGGGGCDAVAGEWTDTWANGGGDYFKKGQCTTLGFTADAAGSRSA